MKLTDMTVTGFSEELASSSPAPGGGSVAALAGSLGAALAAMVSALSLGKRSLAENAPLYEELIKEEERLMRRLNEVIDEDTEAFNIVSAAYSLPKGTEEEKAARSAAIQAGLLKCTETPSEVIDLSLKAIENAGKLLPAFNTSAASDLGVAALCLRTAVCGAWLNVLINVGSLKDREKTEEIKATVKAKKERAEGLAEDLYRDIEKMI